MKNILLFSLLLASSLMAAAQIRLPYQRINYDVRYHFGLIDVEIARGTATVESNDNNLKATLSGETIPWEGRVYCVSDTLCATMTPSDPSNMETITYENGWYRKPTTAEYRDGNFDYDNPANYRNIKGQGNLDASPQTMEAITVTADMLALYYYFHQIDFDSLDRGEVVTIPFTRENGQAEKVEITYFGKTEFEDSGTTYPAYELTFEYTYNGVSTGYPVKTYVGQQDRLPLYYSATLPIGHVEMIYAD